MADSDAADFFLGRQPILDGSERLLAYELLFRNSRQNAASVSCQKHATASVITNAFSELAVGDALGPYRGFINVDRDFLFSDLIELLPSQVVTLEILETVTPDAAVAARIRELKSAGFQIALDDVTALGDGRYDELLTLVDVVKVDLQPISPEEVSRIVARVKGCQALLLAEKVETKAQMEFCRTLGFDLFQGYYFAQPTVIAGKKLDHSQLALMRLTQLLIADADTCELEQIFKEQPGLTMNLLRLTNSVACGTRTRVTSLRHAITLLGRRQLQRWLQLLLFANPTSNGVTPLLQLAASRGRLMEVLARSLRGVSPDLPDQAFMTGIVSLMPALLGQPIADILSQLPLSPEIAGALTDDAQGGPLAALLRLAEASERGEAESISVILPVLDGIDPGTLNLAVARALAWANEIGRENEHNEYRDDN